MESPDASPRDESVETGQSSFPSTAPENNAIINAGRKALAEIAAFFEVEVPGLASQGEGRTP